MNKRVIALILSAVLMCSTFSAYAAESNSEPTHNTMDSGTSQPILNNGNQSIPPPRWSVGEVAYDVLTVDAVEWDTNINDYWYYSRDGMWRGDQDWYPTHNPVDSGTPQPIPHKQALTEVMEESSFLDARAGETWSLISEFSTSQKWIAPSAGRYQVSVYGPGGNGGNGGSRPSSKANMTDGGGGGSSGGYATVIVDLPAGGWVNAVISSTQNVVTTSLGHSWTLTKGSNGTRGGSNSVGLGATIVGQPNGVAGGNGGHNPMNGGGSCNAPNCPWNDGHYHYCSGGSGYDYFWFDHAGGDRGIGGAAPHPAYSKMGYGNGGNGGVGGSWQYSRFPGEKLINKGFAGDAGDTGNGGGVIIGKSALTAPTLTQSFNASTNKSTITASAPGATSMQITYGGKVIETASGSSIAYAVDKNGSYTAVAANGATSLSAVIRVTAIDDAPPVITNTAPAGGWAGSKTTTITLTDAKTPSGMQYSIGSGWVNYSAPFTHTFTANGSINVMARDKWGCTSGNKTISASQIDTTAPTAPSIAKSPATAWHKDNVTITISGGSDAGSGINRYQYNIGGGAWQNYSAAFVVANSTTVNARTVDNIGLVSGSSNVTVNIDRITPTGGVTYNKAWTKNDVILSFSAVDLGGSNVARVRAGDGSWVNVATTAQTVSTNGSYSFTVEDNARNTQTVTEAVTCIDKTLPVVEEINFTKTSDNLSRLNTFFNKQLEIDIKTSDNASGIHTVEYQMVEKGKSVSASAWLPYSATTKPRVAKRFSGAVVARCTDVASNISAVLQADVTAEDTLPTATHTLSTTEWTNGSVNVHLEAMDDLSGVESITLPDGTVVQNDNANYTISANGTYRFIVTDKCRNVLEYDVVVSNIDPTPPTATDTVTLDGAGPDYVIILNSKDTLSGIANITLPDGTLLQGASTNYVVKVNDTYRFVITDNAGNIYTHYVKVDLIKGSTMLDIDN